MGGNLESDTPYKDNRKRKPYNILRVEESNISAIYRRCAFLETRTLFIPAFVEKGPDLFFLDAILIGPDRRPIEPLMVTPEIL